MNSKEQSSKLLTSGRARTITSEKVTIGENNRRNIIAISPICGMRRKKNYNRDIYQPKNEIKDNEITGRSVLGCANNITCQYQAVNPGVKVENREAKESIKFTNDIHCETGIQRKRSKQLVITQSNNQLSYQSESIQKFVHGAAGEKISPRKNRDYSKQVPRDSVFMEQSSINNCELVSKEPSKKLKSLVKRLSDHVETIRKEKNSIEYILHESYKTLKSSQGERVLEALSCQLVLNKQKTGVMSFNNMSFDEPADIKKKQPIPLVEISRQQTESSESDNDNESLLSKELINKLDVTARRQTNAGCGSNRISFEQWLRLKNEQYRRHSIGISQMKKHEEKNNVLIKMQKCKRKLSYSDWLEEKNKKLNESKANFMQLKKVHEEKLHDEDRRVECEIKYNEWLTRKYNNEIKQEEELLIKTRKQNVTKNVGKHAVRE